MWRVFYTAIGFGLVMGILIYVSLYLFGAELLMEPTVGIPVAAVVGLLLGFTYYLFFKFVLRSFTAPFVDRAQALVTRPIDAMPPPWESTELDKLEEVLTDVSTENIVVQEGSGFDKIRIKYKKDFIIERFGEPQVSEIPPPPLVKWAEALDVEYEYYSYTYLPVVFVIFKPKGTIEAILFEKDFRGRLKRGVKIGSTRDEVYEKYGKARRTLDVSGIKYPYLSPRILYVSGRSRANPAGDAEPSGASTAEQTNVHVENSSIIFYPRPFNLTFYFDESRRVERFFITSNTKRKVKKKKPPGKRRS